MFGAARKSSACAATRFTTDEGTRGVYALLLRPKIRIIIIAELNARRLFSPNIFSI